MLRQFLTYKCALAGIPLYLINPAYTSKICHKCLHIGKRNGKKFSCSNSACNWKSDSDYNGAQNISALGRILATPGGSGLACKLKPKVVTYVQLSLFATA